MQLLPQKDDIVWYAIGDEALTNYVVKSVRWQYRKFTQDDEWGDPQEILAGLSDCLPVVVVKEVP